MTRLHGSFGGSLGSAALAAFFFGSIAPSQAAGPFASFAGNWTGAGVISTDNGTKERLRCKAHYDVGGGGDTLAQNLTCASDSYKFHVVSHVRADGDKIAGDWAETSRNATGHISGRIGPTQISAHVIGTGFTASIGIAARAGKQSVTISPTGTDIQNVSVTMSKV